MIYFRENALHHDRSGIWHAVAINVIAEKEQCLMCPLETRHSQPAAKLCRARRNRSHGGSCSQDGDSCGACLSWSLSPSAALVSSPGGNVGVDGRLQVAVGVAAAVVVAVAGGRPAELRRVGVEGLELARTAVPGQRQLSGALSVDAEERDGGGVPVGRTAPLVRRRSGERDRSSLNHVHLGVEVTVVTVMIVGGIGAATG